MHQAKEIRVTNDDNTIRKRKDCPNSSRCDVSQTSKKTIKNDEETMPSPSRCSLETISFDSFRDKELTRNSAPSSPFTNNDFITTNGDENEGRDSLCLDSDGSQHDDGSCIIFRNIESISNSLVRHSQEEYLNNSTFPAYKINYLISTNEKVKQEGNKDSENRMESCLIEPNKTHYNQHHFSLLPDEVLLIIFQHLSDWDQLMGLRTVCKRWNILLKDSRVKHARLKEDLVIMLQNEKKHYKYIREYFDDDGKFGEITLGMREILVDWLVEVAEEFRLRTETLFLTIHYIDRYLSLTDVITRGKLQLLGITALLVASKYEEVYVPTVADIVYIADNTYKKEEVLLMEINLLNSLKFEVSVFCTLKRFVDYFVNAVIEEIPSATDENRASLSHRANFFAELTLINYKFSIKLPSLIATCIVYLALQDLNLPWTHILEKESFYSTDQCKKQIGELKELYNQPAQPHLQAIHNKYSLSKFESCCRENKTSHHEECFEVLR